MPESRPQSDGLGHLTPAQLEAIRETSCSLLVSAAAGSGKTTVLAERCVALVCDVEASRRCDIDQLLVVTFTDAAAEEMRTRIRSALRRKIDEKPDDERLQRQIYLLECASISTIHSFCKTLIERYFPQAEVDPQAAVLSEEEADLLRDEVLDELFLTLYASSEPEAIAFQGMVDDYGAGDDYSTGRVVLQVHNFISTLPDPQRWLDDSLERIRTDGPESLLNNLHACQFERIRAELQAQMDFCQHLSGAIRAAWPVAEMHAEAVAEHYWVLRKWHEALDPARPECWETIAAEIRAFEFGRAQTRPRNLTDDEKAAFDAAKEQRDRVKKYFEHRLRERLCAFTADEYREGLKRIAPHVHTLVYLVREFDRLYTQAKAAQAAVDFNDLLRKAYRLLCNADDPARPSDVARQLQQRYRYVLVDEFQDVDPLQERILRFVSRESAAPPEGNLFTVGDIKQSIYRFRLAEPSLFTARADEFSKGSSLGRVIPLQKNFRSRAGVIDAINLVFETLMSRDFGGSDYDEQARLHAGAAYPEKAAGPMFARPAVEMFLLEPVTERTRVAAGATPPAGATSAANESDDAEADAGEALSPEEELEGIQREGFLIGRLVRHWMGLGKQGKRWFVAGKPGAAGGEPTARPIEYRDIVILLRSLRFKAEPIADVLRRMGVPVRIERQAAALDSTESRDCISVLQLLDNLQQDVPLAAAMRSPLLGPPFGETELFTIRLIDRAVPFNAAVRQYAVSGQDGDLRQKLCAFLATLDRYRTCIQRTPVADVLWELYEESDYLSYVCGLPDGARRREHLVRLHELARQFGRFSRQGLRRFLHFIEELAQSERQPRQAGIGGDENCVRIMTVHASKGLEFPVVVLADLQKKFNLDDTKGAVLVDRRHGIAMRASDPEKRILYPTLAHQLAVEETMREGLSEELRVLYVALTRAREHLVLIGRMSPARIALEQAMQQSREASPESASPVSTTESVSGTQSASGSESPNGAESVGGMGKRSRTRRSLPVADETTPPAATGKPRPGVPGTALAHATRNALPRLRLESAGCALDWLLAAISAVPADQVHWHDGREHGGGTLFDVTTFTRAATDQWRIPPAVEPQRAEALAHIARLEPLPEGEPIDGLDDARRLVASLAEEYPGRALTMIPGRLPVGELKRRWDGTLDPDDRAPAARRAIEPRRPVFVTQEAVCDPTVRGSATHRFLQLVDLSRSCDLRDLKQQLAALTDQDRMTPAEAEAVLVESAAWLFGSELGRRIRAEAGRVYREVAFDARIGPERYDPRITARDHRDAILVRGVVDLILDSSDGLEIVDYKTDALTAGACRARVDAYRPQLDIYATAMEGIYHRPVRHRWLVFLQGRVVVDLD